jgi:aconitate hydratase
VVGFRDDRAAARGLHRTDLVLTVTENPAPAQGGGKFVEFFGEGTRSLAVPDRATIANMAPESAPPWASSRWTSAP